MPSINHPVSRKIEVTLWIVQSILALVFLFAGGSKFVMSADVMTQQSHLSAGFIRFIGALELLGGLGLVLPGLIHLRWELTPLAAAGLMLIMTGAVGATLTTGPVSMAILPVIVGCLAAVVLIGRWKLAPHRDHRGSARDLVLRTAH